MIEFTTQESNRMDNVPDLSGKRFVTEAQLPGLLSNYVPYTGATSNVVLGTHTVTANSFVSNPASNQVGFFGGSEDAVTYPTTGGVLYYNHTFGDGDAYDQLHFVSFDTNGNFGGNAGLNGNAEEGWQMYSGQAGIAVGGDGLNLYSSGGTGLSIGTSGSQVFGLPGSVTSPSYTFLGDNNTGMYSFAGDTLGFATGGVAQLLIGNATIFFNLPVSGSAAIFSTDVTTPSVHSSSSTSATLKLYASTGVAGSSSFVGIYTGTDGGTEIARFNNSSNVGIGTGSSVSARLHLVKTSEQLRVGYDASNYCSTTVSSTGAVTFDAVGSGSSFIFSDKVVIPNGTSDTVPGLEILGLPGFGIIKRSTKGALISLGSGGAGPSLEWDGDGVYLRSSNQSGVALNTATQTLAGSWGTTSAFGVGIAGSSLSGDCMLDLESNAHPSRFLLKMLLDPSQSVDAVRLLNGSTTPIWIINSVGKTGIGANAATPSAWLHIAGTTEQLRSGYDTSNYWRATTSSTGATTFDAQGSGATFIFSDSISLPYVAKTSTYTITAADYMVDCTSGTFTVNLPTAASIGGRQYVVKNSGTGVITIDGSGSETIDGATTYTLSVQYQSITIISDGTNWKIA